MRGMTVHPIEIVMALGLVLVALGLSLGMISLAITAWNSYRQAVRDWRQRNLQVRGPR